jgi:hypothetical protein
MSWSTPYRRPAGDDPDWAAYAPDRARVLKLRRLGLHEAADELEEEIELDWQREQRRCVRARFGLVAGAEELN